MIVAIIVPAFALLAEAERQGGRVDRADHYLRIAGGRLQVRQAEPRGLFASSQVVLALGETVLQRVPLPEGVIVGVLLSGIFFAGKVSRLFRVTRQQDASSKDVTYLVEGQVFFASAEQFVRAFDFAEQGSRIAIDLNRAHLWDITAVGALDKIVMKYRRSGIHVEVLGFNEASVEMIDRFALHDKDERRAASASIH